MTRSTDLSTIQSVQRAIAEMNGNIAQMLAQIVSLNERQTALHTLQQNHDAALSRVSARLQNIESVLQTTTTRVSSGDGGEIITAVMMEDDASDCEADYEVT